MVEMMAALSSPGTDAMKHVDTNLMDVDVTDAHNEADLARAPFEPVYHSVQARSSHRSQWQSS